jgi:hypothetical protein
MASVWRVMRKRITVWPAPQKILEDSGFGEDLVHYSTQKSPISPNPPRRYSFYRIRIRYLLRMGFTGPVRCDTRGTAETAAGLTRLDADPSHGADVAGRGIPAGERATAGPPAKQPSSQAAKRPSGIPGFPAVPPGTRRLPRASLPRPHGRHAAPNRTRTPQDLRVLVLVGFRGSPISLTVMSGPEVSTTWTRLGSRARKARKLRAP